MAIFKPGRLRRTLTPIIGAQAAFGLYSLPLGTIYDDDIASVSIHRGKSDRGGGSHPTTLEVKIRGQYSSSVAGKDVRLFLRTTVADALGAHLGMTGSAIATRFAGRLGQASVEDTGKKFWTTYAAASWITQMRRSPRTTTALAGQTITRVFQDALDLPNPVRGLDVSFHGTFDTVATTQEAAPFTEIESKYGADVGILLRETRDGRTQIMTLPYRTGRVQDQINSTIPLTRSQAISPAQWEQRNESPAIRCEYKITNQAGGVATRVAQLDVSNEMNEIVSVDWSYLKVPDNGGQVSQEAYGRVYQSNLRQYRVPSVTVDLLYLIGSPEQYHRDQAGLLLKLEAGDPIGFAADWPAAVQGVHFVEGINESIGPNEWKLELQLVPYAQAVGLTPSPAVQARTWDSSGNQWNQETKKWSEA